MVVLVMSSEMRAEVGIEEGVEQQRASMGAARRVLQLSVATLLRIPGSRVFGVHCCCGRPTCVFSGRLLQEPAATSCKQTNSPLLPCVHRSSYPSITGSHLVAKHLRAVPNEMQAHAGVEVRPWKRGAIVSQSLFVNIRSAGIALTQAMRCR